MFEAIIFISSLEQAGHNKETAGESSLNNVSIDSQNSEIDTTGTLITESRWLKGASRGRYTGRGRNPSGRGGRGFRSGRGGTYGRGTPYGRGNIYGWKRPITCKRQLWI